MQQVIYADVLLIINFFVTYGLLRLTGIICRSEKRQFLLIAASFISGVYSLIIIIPSVSDFVIALSRLPVGALLIIMSFTVYNIRHFIRLYACFFAVNFIFAGLMFALWYLFAPNGMYFNNGIVYFNISIEMLAVFICVCYFTTLIINKLVSFRAPVNTVYEMEISYDSKKASCRAFYDTGNGLKDAFTAFPIIVIDKEVAEKLFSCEISINAEKNKKPIFRPVFCSTVAGNEMLLSFRPDNVKIKGINCSFATDRVYLAISNRKIKNGEFQALLSNEIFENKTNEKGDYYFATVVKQAFEKNEFFKHQGK